MTLLMDSKAILLSLGIGYVFSLIMISAYWQDHIQASAVKIFFVSKCIQTAAWCLMILRGGIPSFLSVSVGNSAMLIGASLEVIALLTLLHELQPQTKRRYLVYTALGIIGFQLIILFDNQEKLRIAYCSVVIALLILPTCRIALGRNRSLLMRMMGSLYLLLFASTLIRGMIALLTDASTSYYKTGMYQLISLLALYLVSIMLNMGFVLLLKEQTNQELIRLASRDDLTGALNRRTFALQADQCLADHAKRGMPLSYLLFDIDWFKAINDTYGHDAGDHVLQDLASRIKRDLGRDDLFVRYGGDEFGLLLPGMDETASNEAAERIKKVLTGATIHGLPVTYSISIGVLTIVPDAGTQMESLYAFCDKALYTAKRNGRNGVFRGRFAEQGAISS
ncbi:GGDEF domain-containing protein [Paenibacillus rhizovicinus]|uniref:GGDEF domain-containing protein n=1 Tax=Paenibacillus rhizovicinus TaxID=2704463 RepID=A0A6C0P642_9BACL|nr:GGDEF domain-containing protein [Paenibacillus rhizovicinus]QHW32082.1 GGDEF domain-containing protein [Paenibacillus rhizovicinus]